MRNIIDICNVNISNSLHSLYESSILDIEGTIKDGDKINDQFEIIKSLIIDPNAYEKRNNSSSMLLEIKNVGEVLSVTGLNKLTSLIVIIRKYNEPDGQGDYRSIWHFNILIADGKDVELKTNANGLSFTKFLKKYIEPHFKDIESFIKFIKERKLR